MLFVLYQCGYYDKQFCNEYIGYYVRHTHRKHIKVKTQTSPNKKLDLLSINRWTLLFPIFCFYVSQIWAQIELSCSSKIAVDCYGSLQRCQIGRYFLELKNSFGDDIFVTLLKLYESYIIYTKAVNLSLAWYLLKHL